MNRSASTSSRLASQYRRSGAPSRVCFRSSASMNLRRAAISSDVVFMAFWALPALRFAPDGCNAHFGDDADPRVRYPVVAI
jgi:hypothetical protein